MFFEQKDKHRVLEIKILLLFGENGQLYSYFDAYGEMQSFNSEFASKKQEESKNYLYVFTEEMLYVYFRSGLGIGSREKQAQFLKKKSLLYTYPRNITSSGPVKNLIDRYEMIFSRFCDTNDYFTSSILTVKYAVDSFP
ncbi:MAG: hypothetical protein ACMUEM_03355 [Flavobacteriales bacterium AspAUS03]